MDTDAKYDIGELILERIGNVENYKAYWKNGVLKTIGNEINCNIQGITFGFIPNYGGQVQFLTDFGNGYIAITEIQFYVSLLSNVYTIQILEIEEMIENHPLLKMDLPKQVLKEIWVSPDNHPHKDLFLKIKTCIDSIFENPIFLPYSIQQIELKGVTPPTMEDKEKYTVGDVFFRKILPLHKSDCIVLGDPEYEIHKLS